MRWPTIVELCILCPKTENKFSIEQTKDSLAQHVSYTVFVYFHDADDDEMWRRRHTARNHAPFQRQWQHGVRHENDKQHIPN